MAKSPNTTPINGISHSWTQPYLPQGYNPFIVTGKVAEEMAALERTDEIVQTLLTYPLAEAILSKIAKENGND